jgi:hypothetical protein
MFPSCKPFLLILRYCFMVCLLSEVGNPVSLAQAFLGSSGPGLNAPEPLQPVAPVPIEPPKPTFYGTDIERNAQWEESWNYIAPNHIPVLGSDVQYRKTIFKKPDEVIWKNWNNNIVVGGGNYTFLPNGTVIVISATAPASPAAPKKHAKKVGQKLDKYGYGPSHNTHVHLQSTNRGIGSETWEFVVNFASGKTSVLTATLKKGEFTTVIIPCPSPNGQIGTVVSVTRFLEIR